jgi:DNA-binding winged helix-turn-helix (wHTH) protein/Tfp pilus assembly protein PilF
VPELDVTAPANQHAPHAKLDHDGGADADDCGRAVHPAPARDHGVARIIPAYNHGTVAAPSYRFGPFFVDRTRYHVLRDGVVVELTPKLIDLLFHLLDNAGALLTKEQLLDALWPGANVTDNALAQAVSELRQALGDDAGAPKFIKTIARRGYRFVAPVARSDSPHAGPAPHLLAVGADDDEQSIAVIDFANVTGDPDAAWLAAGIAETVTGDLRALDRFRVVDRGRVIDAIRRTSGSLEDIAAILDVPLAVVGSFQRHGDRIRITARIVDLTTGDALADAKVDGLLTDIFALQDRVVAQFSTALGIPSDAAVRRTGSRETPSLEAYRAATEGWLELETLDIREIPHAMAHFERAIAIDPRYALAYTGLASAQLAAYEETRSASVPAADLLKTAIDHARTAVALDDTLAEAHATLAFVLVSAWDTKEAIRSARRAVALEPNNWRHFFRLGHAAWGDERLRAAANTLALYPDFAFAHFQTAMVHVARGHLREAETVLRQGAAVQDRQIDRGDRYPALGLHWLLALVRLAQDDVDEALRELDRERQLAEPHRLYGREYEMNAIHGRGACLLRVGRVDEAADCFRQALTIYPDHAQSHLGLAVALRSAGSELEATPTWRRIRDILATLTGSRPIEAAIVQAQALAIEGRADEAGAVLCTALDAAPPGFAAWTVPIEPFLRQLTGSRTFTAALGQLARRAR